SLDHLLAQICRLHHGRGHKAFSDLGLYRGQPPVLELLWKKEGRTHSDLAAALQVAPATITKMVQRLEKSGWVERRPDPEDQRVSRVYLTPAGRDIHGELSALLDQFDTEIRANLTEEEQATLFGLLMKVRDSLSQSHDAEAGK
ncbi:MAG: MarR family transcriptional regulator, partial [Anaerolineae bacterium]|nr:MarR family transcriptional regulator [Anaerolineae bacterium]